jgi:hypothetical protein
MAEWLKWYTLSSKHEALSSNPSTTKKKKKRIALRRLNPRSRFLQKKYGNVKTSIWSKKMGLVLSMERNLL